MSTLPTTSSEAPAQPAIPTPPSDILIIGSGIAGLSAAEELRKQSPSIRITLLSKEVRWPYYRLSLTRYLAGALTEPKLYIHPPAWYEENEIRLLQGVTVTSLHPAEKAVELKSGDRLSYDKLILATGASPFVPPITGSNLRNVITVRTIEDANYILQQLPTLAACVCIGGGVLGLEIAGAIAKNGVKVHVLEGADWLMPRQLNRQASLLLQQNLASLGVEVLTGVRVKSIVGQEKAEAVLLESGDQLPASLVIIAAGVRPATALAHSAGLEIKNGLVVDNHLQTSVAGIYGAGDVAEHSGTVYGLWTVAQLQGKAAARNALGIAEPFLPVPCSSILKVLDIDLFSIGTTSPAAMDIQLEKQQDGNYFSFILREEKIMGSIIIGDQNLALRVKRMAEKGEQVPTAMCNDVDTLLAYVTTKQ